MAQRDTMARNYTLNIRFSDEEMDYIRFMARETGKKRGPVVREIVFEDLDEYKKGIIKICPTPVMNNKIKIICKKLGVSKEEFVSTLLIKYVSDEIMQEK